MSQAMHHDIGSYITSRFGDQIDAVAAGTGDATESDGAWVDARKYQSAKLIIAWEAVLAATKTLSLAANAQSATDSSGTGAADYGTALAATVVATGPTGGGTLQGVTEMDFNLAGSKGYVRSQITPDLNASGTDTLRLTAVWVFGGGEVIPVV